MSTSEKLAAFKGCKKVSESALYEKGENTMPQNRNIALAILFSIITCGIYALYWLYQISAETRYLTGNTDSGSPGLDLVLEIITCGIFGYFVVYQSGKRMYRAELEQNGHASDDSVMLTILSLFGWIIALAILQSKLNNFSGVSSEYNT